MFIAFEGIDGCGKTTLSHHVHEALQARGIPALLTREPGGTPLGEQLRTILLQPVSHDHPALSPQTQTLLHFAIRAHHLETVIRPALEAGTCVLCDRFVTSTWAYQHAGLHVPAALITMLEEQIVGSYLPDKIVILDITPEESQRRRQHRTPDRYEALGPDFLNRVSDYFRSRQGDRYVVLDGTRPVDELAHEVCALILNV